MNLPVAMIPYANMAPYRQLGAPRGCDFVPLVPHASVMALKSAKVVAAAVPVGGLARLAGVVEAVGRYGIAAKGPSMSVLFFSRVPFDKMHAPHTLRITAETASSVRLLFLLLGRQLGFDRLPRLASDDRPPDGELLIGDRALIRGARLAGEATTMQVTDLSQMWTDLYGLPFVFARWVVRKDAPASLKTAISGWLEQFKVQESELVDRAVPPTAAALRVSTGLVRRYFCAIRRCLDDSDIDGQRRFFEAFGPFEGKPLFEPSDADPSSRKAP